MSLERDAKNYYFIIQGWIKMRKIVYSFWFKCLAFALCLAAACLAAFIAADDIFYDALSGGAYRFETRFENSETVLENLHGADGYLSKLRSDIDDGRLPDEADYAVMERYNVEYYMFYQGVVVTNNSISDPGYYLDSELSIVDNGSSPNYASYESADTYYESYSDYTVMVKLNDGFAAEQRALWEAGRDGFIRSFSIVLILLVVGFLAYIYLLFAAGRRSGDDKTHRLLVDRVWVELNLGAAILSAVLYICGCLICLDMAAGMDNPFEPDILIVLLTAIETAILITLSQSVVRNAKSGMFLKTSVIAIICRWLWRTCVKILKWAFKCVKSACAWTVGLFTKSYSGKRIIIALVLYSLTLIILALIAGAGGWFAFMLAIAATALGAYLILKYLNGFENLRQGIKRIRGGDLGYRITGCPDGFLSEVADDVNEIGDGLRKSVETAVKSERMKSELITNVSHDLKTPLTSIINYADLLSKEKLTPAEANDYVKIICQKSARLKNLTSDLFDISKAQSGAEKVELEDIDVKLLLKQSLAELDSEIKKSGLEFVLNMPEYDLETSADGKKLSRAFDNLISNAVKYSMKGTRVYITQAIDERGLVTEFKNISASPMNFSEEEITERFVRGDKSRSGEGSGLGLAIAKSYVELMGGRLEIKTDGDLFKASVILRPKRTKDFNIKLNG